MPEETKVLVDSNANYIATMRLALRALEDTQTELECEEVAEFISGALDRRVAGAIASLKLALGEE